MRRWLLLLAVVAACGDNLSSSTPRDAAVGDGSIDATGDAAPGRLTGCLDTPGQIPTPPNGQLPCDLVPPGVTL